MPIACMPIAYKQSALRVGGPEGGRVACGISPQRGDVVVNDAPRAVGTGGRPREEGRGGMGMRGATEENNNRTIDQGWMGRQY